MELLWPGVDASTGRRRLRQALSLLRAVLEPPQDNPVPVLLATRLSVRVVPGTIVCGLLLTVVLYLLVRNLMQA